MKLLKEIKWDALLTGILYVVLGLAALLLPETMVRILGYLIAIVLIVAGAFSMIGYLLRDAHQNYYHNDFVYGLVGISLGCIVLYKVEVIISLIPFILGLLVLFSGCTKLQAVIDMKRLECGNWLAMLAVAAANVILGALLMANPFEWMELLFRLLGVGLMLSGITDLAVGFYFAGKFAQYKKALEKGEDKEESKGNDNDSDKNVFFAEKPDNGDALGITHEGEEATSQDDAFDVKEK